jgi:hypothetical protein
MAVAQVNNQAGQGKPSAVPVTPPKNQFPANAKVPLIDQPLRLSDFAGMQPREDLRAKLGHVDRFIQNVPNDGQNATEKTEVWMAHTKSTLYFVFICWDRHPELIRTHLARRENILKDDYVTVALDPFQDRRIGVEFQVNPSGVQADAAWTEANGSDYSYDQVWDSDGRVTKQGWMAMIALPFRSLRFRPAGEDWGVVFYRNFPRNSENDWWPRVSANVSGMLSQEGTLHGIEGVTGSHNVQINPYVLGQNEHTLQSSDPFNPYFSTRSVEATAGGEAKVIVKDSIILDATVNPDFSDVESDQPQFTVNQRYPVYFPELRPFFLENASYFATPLTLLYTRNIIRPEFGGRITGKVDHTNIGILAIDDRAPGNSVPVGDPVYGQKAGFFVGRVMQDVGHNSNVGAIYTDEEFAKGFNRVGGLDFNFRLNDKWTLMGQSAESATQPSRTDSAAHEFPPSYSAGPASYLQLQRNARVFQMEDDYTDVSSGFLTTSGFFQTANIRTDHAHATYQWYPKKSFVQSFGLETNQNLAFDHADNRVYRYMQYDPFVLLPDNIVIAPIAILNSDSLGPQNGYPLTTTRNFAENGGGFVARGQPRSQFNFNLQAFRGGNVNYYPPAGGAPILMKQYQVTALFSLNPVRALTADQTYLLDRDFSKATNAFVYESQVFRTKINYQFTRSISARVIVEYDSTLANPLETSLQRTKQVQTQALFTWLPHPGTAIYVGYNGDLQNLDHTLCARQGGSCDPTQPILPRSNGYLNDGRQFFVKASYLFRF